MPATDKELDAYFARRNAAEALVETVGNDIGAGLIYMPETWRRHIEAAFAARDRALYDQWHEECRALVKTEWLKVKPDYDSQRLRSEIGMRFPDDAIPDWAWDILDIGIQLAREQTARALHEARHSRRPAPTEGS